MRGIRWLALAAVLGLSLSASACSTPAGSGLDPSPPLPLERIEISDTERELWNETVQPYLEADLWLDRDVYDAGHLLMAPVEAAFRAREPAWMQQLSAHFARFAEAAAPDPRAFSGNQLSRLQYLYLATRFLRLSAQSGMPADPVAGLPRLVLGEVERTWLRDPAWQWDAEPFANARERITWRLDQPATDPSYLKALIDEDVFLFAIAGEYRAWERTAEDPESWSTSITEILQTARAVLASEIVATDQGWLLQPGTWQDHPDLAYSGHERPRTGMVEYPRERVAKDSSHSARWPLVLESLRDAQSPSSESYRYYDDLISGLASQFVTAVIDLPSSDRPYPRMANYMDGWNGLYRWNEETGTGYQAWQLSGSIIALWWGLLDDHRVTEIYCDTAQRFPLPQEAVSLYVGPNTTRDRHPLVTWPDFFSNGFAELNTRLACRLGEPA